MNLFEVKEQGKNCVKFSRDERAPFLWAVDYALQAGGKFVVSVSKAVSDIVPEINEAFKKHNVAVKISADSDPHALDYFFSALGGATFGAVGGGMAGVAFWAAVKGYKAAGAVDTVVPGLGLCLAVPAAIGIFVGASAGATLTYYGLRIRFVPTDDAPSGGEALELNLSPAL